MPPTRLSAFLCHSSEDKPVVRGLYKKLKDSGIAAWLDEEELLPGQDWAVAIPQIVKRSDVVLICLSKSAIGKTGFVQKEIQIALDAADERPEGTIFLIPLRLEKCAVPERLKRWHYVNLFDERGYDRLMLALRTRATELGMRLAPVTATRARGGAMSPDQIDAISDRDQLRSLPAADRLKASDGYHPPFRMLRNYTSEDLCDLGIRAVRRVVGLLLEQYKQRPNSSLIPLADLQSGKSMITADKDAEVAFERFIDTSNNGHFKDIDFYGEETLGNQAIDLTGRDGTCVMVDALDGSDLYERDLGNWCTAATFFTPNARPGRRLRAAVAGLPDGSIYYGTDTSRSVEVIRKPKSPPEKVRGMSSTRSAETACICFYGQKVGNFLAGAETPLWPALFARDVAQRIEKRKVLRLRIYNLAGIPMILKMVDKVAKNGAGIDAVVDFKGQKAHDVVPGAFLALKAGAQVVEPDGTPITIRRLEEVLLRPNTESLAYIIAVSKELKDNIVKLNRPSRAARKGSR